MKLLILTEGGRNIGFGHLTRCIALYQAFEEKGIISEFIINGDKSILDFLKNKNYQLFNWFKDESKLFKLIKDANIVIIDSYLADKSLYDRISEITCGRIVMIDDCKRLKYPKGIVVNPSIYGDRINYPRNDGIVYLLGKDYIILRKEFWNVPENKINREIKDILITFGGMNHSDLANKIIRFLRNLFHFNFYFVDLNKGKLSAEEMLNMMLKVDIAILGGGQTTYELARCGVPALALCFADNQLLNIKSLEKIGFLGFIGWYNDRGLLKKIEKSLINLDYKKRIKMSRIGRRFIEGHGARRVADAIIKIYSKHSAIKEK